MSGAIQPDTSSAANLQPPSPAERESFSAYINIVGPVFYNKQFSDKTKLLYGLLAAMTQAPRYYAFAKNSTLMRFLDCSERTLQRCISELEDAGLEDCDAFLSMSGMDEMNMVTSLFATSRKIPQVVTKLGRPENTLLAGELDLGSIICPRELCSNDIVRYVRAMENQIGAAISVHGIADGKAEAVEFLVEEGTRNCGVPLKELKLRPGVLLATISHGGKVEIPHGDSQLRLGDSVVAVTTARGSLQKLNDIFA